MRKMGQPIYDDSIELKLSSLLCKLDEHPKLCINPVEASSYMGFTLAGTEKGFLKHIKENLFDAFISYMESYKNYCANAYAVKTHFIPIIKRLHKQYKDAVDSLYTSNIRDEWSVYFYENETSDILHNKTKQAYQFFYRAAGVQIFFLGKLIDKMKEYLVELESAIPKPEPEYYFSIMPEFIAKRHYILYEIHKNLFAEGYINCTPEAFKKVFTTKEPKAIYWLKSQRSLTYMIHILTGWFLEKKDKPTNNYIAERYFHIIKKGIPFHPKRVRPDDDPKKTVVEFLDKVIDNAIRTNK